MEKFKSVGDKIEFLTGNPIDFGTGEYKTISALFRAGLKEVIKEVPKSGRIKIKLKITRSK